jgi:hypothetical protein
MSNTNWIQEINKTPSLRENSSYQKLIQTFYNVIFRQFNVLE